jgi:hypothetical protein
MGIFKDRSDFFKGLATGNKKIAHGREIDGEIRNSFHRLNDEEELLSACINFAHFPCLVHFGFDGRYTSENNAVSKRLLNNDIIVLQKVDEITGMDQREEAYDLAFEILEELLSKMHNLFETEGRCGPFDNFDLSKCSFLRYSVNGNLYGWLLSFTDEVFADSINDFDASKWYEE